MASDNAVASLVSALHRLAKYNGDVRFDEVTREFFRRIAPGQLFPASWLMRHAGHPLLRPLVALGSARSPALTPWYGIP